MAPVVRSVQSPQSLPAQLQLQLCSVAALEIVIETTKTFSREPGEGTAKLRARSMQQCYKQFNEVFKDRSEEFAIKFLKY